MNISIKTRLIPVLITGLAMGSAMVAHAAFDRSRKKTVSNCTRGTPWTVTFLGFAGDWDARAGLKRKSAEPVPMPPAGFEAPAAAKAFPVAAGESVTLMIDPPPGQPKGVGWFLLQGPEPWREVRFEFPFDAEDEPSGKGNRLAIEKRFGDPGAAHRIFNGQNEIFLLDPVSPGPRQVAPDREKEQKTPDGPSPDYGKFLEPRKRIHPSGLASVLP
jgi:hypothetical protein